MALTPTDNEAFLREVDENLRLDQMTGLAKRWGIAAAAVVILALLALAGFLWWRHHQAALAGAEGEQLAAVINDIDVGRAQPTDPRLAALAGSSS